MTLPLKEFRTLVHEARARIEPYIYRTPLKWSPFFSGRYGVKVYLKMENEQVSGSIKGRSVFNKLCRLLEEDPEAGRTQILVTASTGNNALASAHATRTLGMKARVYMPENVSPSKDARARSLGIEARYVGRDIVEAETAARREAKEEGLCYFSPYNDLDVMTAQGTMAAEVLDKLPDIDAIFLTVGGGGMIGGIGAYVKAVKPECKIIGCSPRVNRAMHKAVIAGEIRWFECLETLSDGTGGNVEDGSVTFHYCQEFVDQWLVVEEEEISRAMFLMMEQHQRIVEGAAGVAIAAFMKEADKWKGKNVAIIICGGNVGMEVIKTVIDKNTKISYSKG